MGPYKEIIWCGIGPWIVIWHVSDDVASHWSIISISSSLVYLGDLLQYIYLYNCQSSCSSIYWEFTRYLSNSRDYSTHLRIREIGGKKKSGKKSNAPGGNFRNLCPHLRFSNILISHMGKSHIWFMSLVLLLYTPVCFLIHSFFFF